MADWIVDGGGDPPMDLAAVDIRRSFGFQADPHYLEKRISESLGLLYAMHWPFFQYESARNIRLHHPCTIASKRRGRCSARPPAGSAPTGSPPRAWSVATSTASASRTGSRRPARSAGPHGSGWRCSTRALSPSSRWRVPMRWRFSIGWQRPKRQHDRRPRRQGRLHAVVQRPGSTRSRLRSGEWSPSTSPPRSSAARPSTPGYEPIPAPISSVNATRCRTFLRCRPPCAAPIPRSCGSPARSILPNE